MKTKKARTTRESIAAVSFYNEVRHLSTADLTTRIDFTVRQMSDYERQIIQARELIQDLSKRNRLLNEQLNTLLTVNKTR